MLAYFTILTNKIEKVCNELFVINIFRNFILNNFDKGKEVQIHYQINEKIASYIFSPYLIDLSAFKPQSR